jgi:hypothetical protein
MSTFDSNSCAASLSRQHLRMNRRGKFRRPSGANQFDEKLVTGAKSSPRVLKREHIFNDLVARVNSCPSRNDL